MLNKLKLQFNVLAGHRHRHTDREALLRLHLPNAKPNKQRWERSACCNSICMQTLRAPKWQTEISIMQNIFIFTPRAKSQLPPNGNWKCYSGLRTSTPKNNQNYVNSLECFYLLAALHSAFACHAGHFICIPRTVIVALAISHFADLWAPPTDIRIFEWDIHSFPS